MSASDTKFLLKKESVLGSGSHKKFKRKRHRNKCKNSSLKKKKIKKFNSTNTTTSSKSSNFKFSPFSENKMSNWYWSNYRKAVEWQNKHKIAHWKACALSLYEENRYLLQIINSIHPSMIPEMPVTQQNLECTIKKKVKTKLADNFTKSQTCGGYDYEDMNFNVDDDDGDGDDGNDQEGVNDDIEFEMSEEMMEFFVQSYKNKMDLKKLKEKELLDDAEQEVKQIQNNKIKRSTEMNFLYGEGASMIIGMETAVQLTFDKYCDTKSPKYWPNIPFKL